MGFTVGWQGFGVECLGCGIEGPELVFGFGV